jgi:uncharacterized protein
VRDATLAGVPVRVAEPAAAARGAVLLLHGLGARKEVQDAEAASLAAAGYQVVTPDAPHHGARRGPLLDAILAATGSAAHELFLDLVEESAAELPRLVDALGAPAAVVGISLGAYVALAAAAADPRLAPIVSILGSPDWTPPGAPTERTRAALTRAPVHHAERFPPRPLLLANAGRDVSVPPGAARAFAADLAPRYRDPARLSYVEYPESEHRMRGQDWDDLWRRVRAFLGYFVAPAAAAWTYPGPWPSSGDPSSRP